MAGERVKKRTPQDMLAAAKARRQAPPLAHIRPVVRGAAAPKARTQDERIALAVIPTTAKDFFENPRVKARARREGYQLYTLVG